MSFEQNKQCIPMKNNVFSICIVLKGCDSNFESLII